ncbi:MAG: cytochrome b5 domain-containing protein [Pseudomonadota bacterium]
MKRLVLLASIGFWLAMAAIWAAASWLPAPAPQVSEEPPAAPAEKLYTTAEIARHDSASSCWLIVAGRVYDVTAYIGEHPADPDTILRYCGKDATRGFDTKDRGRPHSGAARRLLEDYFIGRVSD